MPEFSDMIALTDIPAELREKYEVDDAHYDACWRAVRSGAVKAERLGRGLLIRRTDLPVLAKALADRPRRRSTAEPTPLPRPKPRPQPAGPSLPPAA